MNRCWEEKADALKELSDFREQVLEEECITVSTIEEINITCRFAHYFGWNGSVRICGDVHMDMRILAFYFLLVYEYHKSFCHYP